MLLDTPYRCANTSRRVIPSQIEFLTSNCPTDKLESTCEKNKDTGLKGMGGRTPGKCPVTLSLRVVEEQKVNCSTTLQSLDATVTIFTSL